MELTEYNLKGKTFLITGASSGIGKQIAIDISMQGANIIITGRNRERLNNTLSECLQGKHKIIDTDLTNSKQLSELVTNIDKIDGVVYSAGITENMPIKFIEENYLNKIIDINFNAPVLLISQLLRKKKINKNSSIVFISSISSKYTAFGTAIYSSSKAALETFSNTLALEQSSKRIRSNCVLPAFVETELLEDVKKSMNEETLNNFKNMLPLGFGKPTDVSKTVLFLLSENSNWITGQNIRLGAI